MNPTAAPPKPSRSRARRATFLYSIHPSISYAQAILENLPRTTGKSLAQWIRILEADGPVPEKERREWLKKHHKIGDTTAWMIAERASGQAGAGTDPQTYLRAAADYVEAMYAGPKAGLRPLHDALVRAGRSLGPDVKICPCKTIVPLYRNHVFAQIKPSTRTRIDFGLALKGVRRKPPRRLLETGGLQKGDRITHRIPLSSPDEIDDTVLSWLRIAHDLDAA